MALRSIIITSILAIAGVSAQENNPDIPQPCFDAVSVLDPCVSGLDPSVPLTDPNIVNCICTAGNTLDQLISDCLAASSLPAEVGDSLKPFEAFCASNANAGGSSTEPPASSTSEPASSSTPAGGSTTGGGSPTNTSRGSSSTGGSQTSKPAESSKPAETSEEETPGPAETTGSGGDKPNGASGIQVAVFGTVVAAFFAGAALFTI